MATELQNDLGEARGQISRRTVPFDYAFRYELTGDTGRIINRTVEVSVEATFVAVSIGYGVIPKITPVRFGFDPVPVNEIAAALNAASTLSIGSSLLPARKPIDLDLSRIILRSLARSINAKLPETSGFIDEPTPADAVVKSGIRLNPDLRDVALFDDGLQPLDPSISEELFEVVGGPLEPIQFLYAIFDEGSGREFQSEPILNIAGLGTSNGDRPFRYFAKPIEFAPRSTIRMQVTEVSRFIGDLHVSLQGYKVLGGAGTPTGRKIRRRMRGARR